MHLLRGKPLMLLVPGERFELPTNGLQKRSGRDLWTCEKLNNHGNNSHFLRRDRGPVVVDFVVTRVRIPHAAMPPALTM